MHLRLREAAAGVLLAVVLAAPTALAPPVAAAAPTAPAPAETCDGVTVVVEPNALGGPPEVSCVTPTEGDTGADLFEKAGHPLTYVTSMPNVVCRIDGRPEQAGCAQMPPANAYWSLWITDDSGAWSYASRNVSEISVTFGQGVAFTWVDDNVVTAPATVLGDAVGAPSSPSPESSAEGSGEESPEPLPVWVAPAAILVLFTAAATIRWRRS